jgi:hypothetical protein
MCAAWCPALQQGEADNTGGRSPDGAADRIRLQRDGNWELCRAPADGTGLALTDNSAADAARRGCVSRRNCNARRALGADLVWRPALGRHPRRRRTSRSSAAPMPAAAAAPDLEVWRPRSGGARNGPERRRQRRSCAPHVSASQQRGYT